MNNHLYLLQVSCSNIKLLFIFNLKKITSFFVFLRKLICWKETFTHNECINNNIPTPIINIRSKSIFTNSNLRFEEYTERGRSNENKSLLFRIEIQSITRIPTAHIVAPVHLTISIPGVAFYIGGHRSSPNTAISAMIHGFDIKVPAIVKRLKTIA